MPGDRHYGPARQALTKSLIRLVIAYAKDRVSSGFIESCEQKDNWRVIELKYTGHNSLINLIKQKEPEIYKNDYSSLRSHCLTYIFDHLEQWDVADVQDMEESPSSNKKAIALTLKNLPFPDVEASIKEFLKLHKKYYINKEPVPRPKPQPVPESSELPRNENIPASWVPRYVGRDKDLEAIHSGLSEVSPSCYLAITGMGGLGKTELTIQYARRYKNDYPGGRYWIDVRGADPVTQILSIAKGKGYEINYNTSSVEQELQQLWELWTNQKTLLIFDDVEKMGDIQNALPKRRDNFHVLITSRTQDLGYPVKNHRLTDLSEESALELLGLYITRDRIYTTTGGEEGARKIIDFLGFLPLGIELIGRYLCFADNEDSSLSDLAKYLWKKRENWENEEQSVIDEGLLELHGEPLTTAQRGVKEAFELTWNILDDSTRVIGKFVSTCSSTEFDWRLVSQPLTAAHVKFGIEEFSPQKQKAARQQMMAQSLLKRVRKGSEKYFYHPLLKDFFRGKMTSVEKERWSPYYRHVR